MKSQSTLAVVVILGGASLLLAQTPSRPSAVLASAREATGIRTGGPQLRSVRMEGTRTTTQNVRTDQNASVYRSTTDTQPLVVDTMPPHRYVMTRPPFSVSQTVSREGIDRGRAILEYRQRESPESPWVRRESYPSFLEVTRIEFARLALGMFASADVIPAATVSDQGPNTVAVQAAVGSRSFVATLDLDPATRLPARQTWRSRTRLYPPNTILGSIGESSGGAGPADPSDRPEIEIVMAFSDHRLVSGFRLPFRITRSSAGIILSEMRFTKIEVNPDR